MRATSPGDVSAESGVSHPEAVLTLHDFVTLAASGDEPAFRELYERHATSVYNMALRSTRDAQLAEDVCQETWMKVHRELPKLREPAAFTVWLYRITAKACIDAARRRARRPAYALVPADVIDARPGPEPSALHSERSTLTWEALATLPTNQHLALFLKEVEGRSYRDISQILDMSETAVGLCLLRARRSFHSAFARLQETARDERCGFARTTMAMLIDGEANAVQRRAVQAHVETCHPCATELVEQRSMARQYAALALAPVPAALSAKVFAAHAAGAAAAQTGGLVNAISSRALSVKPVVLAVTAGTSITVAALVAAGPVSRSRHPAGVPSAGVPAEAPARVGGSDAATHVSPGAGPSAPATVVPETLLIDPTIVDVARLPDVTSEWIATVTGVAKVSPPPLPDVRPPLTVVPNIVATVVSVVPPVPTPAVPTASLPPLAQGIP